MSGGTIAYHLRPNKAVDRHLFIDLLTRIHGYSPIHDHTYIGFGGPFLEDFRIIHSQFGIRSMVSLELSQEVYERQKFNKPLACIRCRNVSSGDFISEYNVDGNSIIWLDYAIPKQLRQQLDEFRALLPQLRHMDVVKITLNANLDTLGGQQQGMTREDLAESRLTKLRQRIDDFLPQDVSAAAMTRDGYPVLLYHTLERTFRSALAGSRAETFLPLTSFYYADSGHTMLTLTGIVLNASAQRGFIKKSRVSRWELALPKAGGPLPINVPSLSTRERLFVDRLLPKHKARTILRRLKFLCEDGEEETLKVLTSYALFYRHYPYFSRVFP